MISLTRRPARPIAMALVVSILALGIPSKPTADEPITVTAVISLIAEVVTAAAAVYAAANSGSGTTVNVDPEILSISEEKVVVNKTKNVSGNKIIVPGGHATYPDDLPGLSDVYPYVTINEVDQFNMPNNQLQFAISGVVNHGNVTPPCTASNFGAKTDFATGSAPVSVAIADVNGNANPDLVVANDASNTVSVLLGDGTGGFGAKTDFATGNTPVSVAVMDVSGDGKLDLAVANANSNTVSVLLGNGTGGFGAKTDFATGNTPVSVAIADVSGDGKTDIMVANSGSNTVSVLLGNGLGGFGPKTDFATGSGPSSVAVADVNGDGKLDLALANAGANTVSVLLGNGTGGFGAKTDFATGSGPTSVAIADLSGDGKPDLAVANVTASTVSVLLGNGAGGFGTKTDYATGLQPYSIAIRDVNGDSRPDLALANQNGNSISVLLGSGAGAFGTKTDFATGTLPTAVAIGDLTGDGRLDAVAANQSSNTVSVLLNTSCGPGEHPAVNKVTFDIDRHAAVTWTRPAGAVGNGTMNLVIDIESLRIGTTSVPSTSGHARWELTAVSPELGTVFQTAGYVAMDSTLVATGAIGAGDYVSAPGSGRASLTNSLNVAVAVPAALNTVTLDVHIKTSGLGQQPLTAAAAPASRPWGLVVLAFVIATLAILRIARRANDEGASHVA